MISAASTRTPSMILDEVEVVTAERLSPSFVRVELGGPALADLGIDGPSYDQRIKLVFPDASGRLPLISTDDSWYASWLKLPEGERGHVRTYTVRAVRGVGAGTRLVVDFVLHLAPGATGPGSRWASAARPGDRLVVLAPRRGVPFGGIEFAPGEASSVLLVADETAVPAVSAILEQLPPGLPATAFLEVPEHGDILDLAARPGAEIVWLPRGGAPYGGRLVAAVRRHLRVPDDTGLVETVDPDLWETPTCSSSGEALPAERRAGGLYAWIAGESRMVTTLRRSLVRDVGVERSQVAFMGYWREGVAMRS